MALEQQQQQAPATPPHGVIQDDADQPPAAVDVDIENGQVSEVQPPAAAAAPAAQPPRSLPRPQARIQNLTHEVATWQNTAQRLEQELVQARRQAQEANAGREQAERVGMENLVQRTKAEMVSAKAALKQAKDAGDSEAEVEAQARLARAAAEEADADAWTATQPKAGAQPQQQPQQQQQPQPQQQQEVQPVSGAVRDFIADNSWFSVVKMGQDGRPMKDQSGRFIQNPDYDEALHDAAMLEHKKIAREIERGTVAADYVESPEYFQRIANKVAAEFPDAFEADEQAETPPPKPRTPQMSATKQPVAPTTRQVPGAQPARQGSKMRLDGDEAALVRNLVDNGTMIYPRNHQDSAKRGQKMSYDDAYVKYAREKQADAPNRNNQNQQ